MSAQAFVDESARGSSYYVAVAIVANGDVDELRRLARSFCLSGQRRWHFVNERDSRRRQIVEAIVDTGQVAAFAFYGKGPDNQIQPECLRQMIGPLLDLGVTRLLIESRQGRDELDRQVLLDELRRRRHPGLTYLHMPPHADPLLWIADALAWCSSAGGQWRERIAPISTGQDVTVL